MEVITIKPADHLKWFHNNPSAQKAKRVGFNSYEISDQPLQCEPLDNDLILVAIPIYNDKILVKKGLARTSSFTETVMRFFQEMTKHYPTIKIHVYVIGNPTKEEIHFIQKIENIVLKEIVKMPSSFVEERDGKLNIKKGYCSFVYLEKEKITAFSATKEMKPEEKASGF